MNLRKRRIAGFAAKTVAAWILAVFVIAELLRPNPSDLEALGTIGLVPSDGFRWRLARAIVAGTTAGILSTIVELTVLPRRARRFTPGVMLLVRTAVYATITGLSVLITVRFIARRELRVPVEEFFFSETFQFFVRSGDLLQFVVGFVVASFLISASFEVSRLLGPGTARQILFGRYQRPVEEDRVFMFVDIEGSTGLSEELGATRFARLKNDFFHDLSEPALDTRAQIVQYVGDEVLLTWPMAGGDGPSAAIRFFYLLQDQVARNAPRYRSQYGVVPRFRGGLHGGHVVVSQLGDIKREIVFSGDPVNAASRIQGQCRELGEDFIASELIAQAAELPGLVEGVPLGPHHLRGMASPMELVALRRGERSAATTADLNAGGGGDG